MSNEEKIKILKEEIEKLKKEIEIKEDIINNLLESLEEN